MSPRDRESRPHEAQRAIEAGKIPPVWLWAGPEEYLKDDLWARVVEATIPAGLESMNVSRFRGPEDDPALVIGTCRTLPMMAEKRAVIYRDVDRLSKGEEGTLAAYLGSPSPETVLVLLARDLPTSPRNRRWIEAGAVPVVFWVLFERDTVEWIRTRFRDLGKTCDAEVARQLWLACGAGPGQEKVLLAEIAPEIEKVALSLGTRDRVGPEDVTGIGRRIDESLRDEVLDAFGAGDAPGAFRALDGLLLFKEWDEVRLLANLTHRVLALSRVRELQEAGASSREIAAGAGVWPKQLEGIERAARGWRSEHLRRCVLLLAGADRALKSTGRPPRVVLETVLLQMATLRTESSKDVGASAAVPTK